MPSLWPDILDSDQYAGMPAAQLLPGMAYQRGHHMQIVGSIKSIWELERMLTTSFDSICIKDGGGWLRGGRSQTFTRIYELYPDHGNPFQHTVWLRFTYCLRDGKGEMKVSRRDVERFLRAIAERNIRLEEKDNAREAGNSTENKNSLENSGGTEEAIETIRQ